MRRASARERYRRRHAIPLPRLLVCVCGQAARCDADCTSVRLLQMRIPALSNTTQQRDIGRVRTAAVAGNDTHPLNWKARSSLPVSAADLVRPY
ncbi:hypothetical protein BDW22DRAFT_1354771, partial [Trametopsis cervina]